MKRRWILASISALALGAVPALASPPVSLPRASVAYYLGPKMIRAEIVLQANGALHDFRIDVGRIRSTNSATQSATLKERDGTVEAITVSPTARVKVNGGSSTFAAMRPGMYALTIRDGNAPAEQVFSTRNPAKLVLPRALAAFYLGPKMIRAEIVLQANGALHDFRIDVGRIRSTSPAPPAVTLKEKDGTMVSISVSSTARIRVNGTLSSFAALRPGLHATTIRDGDRPAEQVVAAR